MLQQEQLDGLIAVTPAERNAEMAIGLLPHHVPLLIEKPSGVNSGEARRLLQALSQERLIHMVSYNRRFSPAFQRILAWIQQDAAGRRPSYVLGRMLRHGRVEDNFVRETATHMLDLVLSVLGRALRGSSVGVEAATRRCRHFHSTVHFADNRLAQLLIAPDSGAVEESYEIHGPGYCAYFDFWRCRASIVDQERSVLEWRAPDGSLAEYREGIVEETRAFLSLLEGASLAVPLASDGLAALQLAEAIETGGTVEVGG
jgi:predicted dehydrogenase